MGKIKALLRSVFRYRLISVFFYNKPARYVLCRVRCAFNI